MPIAITSTTVATASLIVAFTSLTISVVQAWFTLLRRGRLAMTRPTLIVFTYDILDHDILDSNVLPKIFMRTLLYTTGNRGHIIESMYLKVTRAGVSQDFTFWGYGATNQLTLGSGLRVGPDGVAYNHHFNPSKHDDGFEYLAGDYLIQVFANLAGSHAPHMLYQATVTLTNEHSQALKYPEHEIHFEWRPDAKVYHPLCL
jgi:hypothetical protein